MSYNEVEKKMYEVRNDAVEAVRERLEELGYSVGDKPSLPFPGSKFTGFNIMSDRILFVSHTGEEYHPDNLSMEDLMKGLRSAYHCLPKQ